MVQTKMAVKSAEDEMYDLMAKEIAKEIDDSIMSNILVETGWTIINFSYTTNKNAVDIAEWLDSNCQSSWRRLAGDYLFENKQDAEWFILRWA